MFKKRQYKKCYEKDKFVISAYVTTVQQILFYQKLNRPVL